jgi:adenylate kinase
MRIVITGPAGSGKGSLARFFVKEFSIPHISSGDIFRSHAKVGTGFGKKVEAYLLEGKLVPDNVAIETICARLEESDCIRGFILDGFPRSVAQAEGLAKQTDIDFIVQIVASDETVFARLCGRYMCKKCGTIYNSRWDDVSKCKKCNCELYQRIDDRDDIIRKRLDQYRRDEKDILTFYLKRGTKIYRIHSELQDQPEEIYKKFIKANGGEIKNVHK